VTDPACFIADLLGMALTALIPGGALYYHGRLTSRFISSIRIRCGEIAVCGTSPWRSSCRPMLWS